MALKDYMGSRTLFTQPGTAGRLRLRALLWGLAGSLNTGSK